MAPGGRPPTRWLCSPSEARGEVREILDCHDSVRFDHEAERQSPVEPIATYRQRPNESSAESYSHDWPPTQ